MTYHYSVHGAVVMINVGLAQVRPNKSKFFVPLLVIALRLWVFSCYSFCWARQAKKSSHIWTTWETILLLNGQIDLHEALTSTWPKLETVHPLEIQYMYSKRDESKELKEADKTPTIMTTSCKTVFSSFPSIAQNPNASLKVVALSPLSDTQIAHITVNCLSTPLCLFLFILLCPWLSIYPLLALLSVAVYLSTPSSSI